MLLRMRHKLYVPDANIVSVSGELCSATASTREEEYVTQLFIRPKKVIVRNTILTKRSVPNEPYMF